jgi:glycine cleavage system H protein
MVALLVLLTILVFLTIDYFIQRRRIEGVAARATASEDQPLASTISALRAPLGVFFSPDHTWLFLEPSGSARLGVTDFARSILGKVDAIRTRYEGEEVKQGDEILRMRHGTRWITFRSPVAGTVEKVNPEMLDNGSAPDAGPYTASWIYRLRPSDTSQIPRNMLVGPPAKKWLAHEIERLKFFLATLAPEHRVLGVTLQDGGIPVFGLADTLGDGDWEKLLEHFFRKSAHPVTSSHDDGEAE